MNSPTDKHAHLPRLDPRWYRGFAFVHWTMTIKNRATGWLDTSFHQRFREVLLHSLMSKKRAGEVACPVYCLMPDHLHLLLIGWESHADQRGRLMPFLRRQLNAELVARRSRDLGEIRLQKQVYDHVLREGDREQAAVERTVFYITENPQRAGLVDAPEAYAFTGCVVPGYPELDRCFWRQTEFWTRFWRIDASKRRTVDLEEA